MNINWSKEESAAIRDLAIKKELTTEGVVRRALRTYQLVDHRLREGLTMAWLDKDGNRVPEDAGGCGEG